MSPNYLDDEARAWREVALHQSEVLQALKDIILAYQTLCGLEYRTGHAFAEADSLTVLHEEAQQKEQSAT